MTAPGRVPPGVRAASAAARVLSLLLSLLILLLPRMAASAESGAGSGYVESVALAADQRQLQLSGWVAPARPGVFVTNLIVRIGEVEVYRGRMHRFERPDVAKNTGRADWLWSGFRATIALPPDTPAGRQPLRVSARLGDGSEFELSALSAGATVLVPPVTLLAARPALLAAVLGLGAPLLVLLGAGPARRWLAALGVRAAHAVPLLFAGSLALSFALLVGAGLTGSSLGLAFEAPALARADGLTRWAGAWRPVRSDEWEVITPLALAQLRHVPALPVVNRHLGADGQNMLVIGMTGVPVRHWSALARPATWGFFALDLRRALAWYWWLPFFACFAALWVLLLRLFSLDWRIAAGLAASVAFAPYSVVFSGWPAYAVFFPVFGLVLADVALRTRRVAVGAACGAGLGWAAAGFALVLYPSWQISLAWLLAPLALAWCWRERRSLAPGRAQLWAVLLALAVSALLLGAWWHGAHEAVQTIRGTVYPGQRGSEVGGDIDAWFLVKGLLSPLTMYLDSAATNASDAGSFVLLPFATGVAVLLAWIRARRVDAVAAVLLGFLALVLLFMFVGFDARLARWSGWSSTTSYRMDLALGLAQLLLFGWLLAPARAAVDAPPPRRLRVLAALVALLAALQAGWQLQRLPPEIAVVVPAPLGLLACVALGVAAWWLLLRRERALLLLYGGWMLGSALPFNPLGQAPTAITLDAGLRAALDEGAPGAPGASVAVLEQRDWSMTLPAAGVPVVNSVFYHPQPGLWRSLDPDGAQRVLYNRYQRLLFVLVPLDAADAPWRIDSPRLDEVRVTLDPARFDFGLLGAGFVLAPARRAAELAANATLGLVASGRGHALFRVTADQRATSRLPE